MLYQVCGLSILARPTSHSPSSCHFLESYATKCLVIKKFSIELLLGSVTYNSDSICYIILSTNAVIIAKGIFIAFITLI